VADELLDLLSTAVVLVDAGGAVASLNHAAADLLATSPAAARGRPLAALVADGAAIEALLARCRAGE
jgi:nitrogen-specific signal transduction histidine kinase